MKSINRLTFSLLAALAGQAFVPSAQAADVGVSVSVNQPGLYGRVDIGNLPPPPVALYSPQPVLIAPPQVRVVQPPVYLYVPVEHQRHWARYCGRYSACGQPVYFVQEKWVREHYRHPPGHAYGHEKHHHHDDDDDHDHDRGHGHGHGKHGE